MSNVLTKDLLLIGKYVNLMFNVMRQMNTKIDKKK